MKQLARLRLRTAALVSPLLLGMLVLPALAADPFASNNGLYPAADQWQGLTGA